jgi:hypothetical protein
MNKIAISLIALAALSTASFAADHDDDLRTSGVLLSGYGTQLNGNSTGSNAIVAVNKNTGALTAFELAGQNAVESVRNDSH